MIVNGVHCLPTSAKRLVGGVKIPKFTEDELRLRFNFKGSLTDWENRWMLPLVAEIVDPMFVIVGEVRYTAAHMNASIKNYHGQGDEVTWWDYIARQTCDVNGQLKNYCVAIRTWEAKPVETLRVLVKGSRAMMGGGRWHEMYAHYLARYVKKATIDMYDPAEISEEFVARYGDNQVLVRRHPQLYEGDGRDYDVAIDDAYEHARGTVPWTPKSKYWSLKDQSGSRQLFLHHSEGRSFSWKGTGRRVTNCPCRVCEVIENSATDQLGYDYLRLTTLILGRKGCSDVVHGDAQAQSDLMARLVSFTELRTPGEVRAAVSLSGTLPLTGDGMRVMAGTYGDRVDKYDYVKDRGFFKRKMKYIETDKTVSYVGVNPSEIPFVSKPSTSSATYTVSFVVVANSWDLVTPQAEETWVPSVEARKRFVFTGKVYGRFYNYIRPSSYAGRPNSVILSKVIPSSDEITNLTGRVQSDTPLEGYALATSLSNDKWLSFAGAVQDDVACKIVGPSAIVLDTGYSLSPSGVLSQTDVGFRASTLSFVVAHRQAYRNGVAYFSSVDWGEVKMWSRWQRGSVYVYASGPLPFLETLMRVSDFKVS